VSDNFKPPVSMWSARADVSVEQVVMAYFGVQSKGDDKKGRACGAFRNIVKSFGGDHAAGHHDLVHYVDAEGYDNFIAVAYWDNPKEYELWNSRADIVNWWASDDRLKEGIGYFREVLSPRMEQFETIFTAEDPLEGVGVLMGGVSEPIMEHGYWGSMRDRFPLSQTDTMEPSGEVSVKEGAPKLGGRVIMKGHQNLAVIRSGQDWGQTEGEEREIWMKTIEPVLREGMDYLRDEGMEAGCYSNRYVQLMDEDGNPIEKSFGVSHWRSLAHLELWAESHPTHLSIFVTFNRLAKKFKNLKLYHEVSVFDTDAQYYEYINCHPKTGMLKAA
jgi:aldoxime dehydratase